MTEPVRTWASEVRRLLGNLTETEKEILKARFGVERVEDLETMCVDPPPVPDEAHKKAMQKLLDAIFGNGRKRRRR